MRGINHAEDFGWAAVARFGGGGGGGTTTATTNSIAQPWGGQQPYLSGIQDMSTGALSVYPGIFPTAAQDFLYAKPQYYPGETYQGMLPAQSTAQTQLYNVGLAGGTPALQSGAAANQAVTNPNYTAGTQTAFNAANPAISGLSSGGLLTGTTPQFNQSQGYLSNLMAGGPTGTLSTYVPYSQNQNLLSSEIGGSYLNPATDPGFQSVVNTTLANTMPSITSAYAGAGRSDSGLASRAAAQGATDAIGNLTLQNYLAERQNQMSAGQQATQTQLAQQAAQEQAAQQAAANQATALGATETAQGLASNNLLTQQGNQIKGIALAPMTDQAVMSDYNTALQAAGLSQQDTQNFINSQIQKWNYNQMLPWNTLGLYNSMIQGNYGNSTSGTQTQPYYTNPTANAISGIAGGISTAAALASLIAAL